ncbi:carbamoyltransferase HypF [Laspinema olomoucense]|uniref:Carbamoyltransferase n=1 Tax=Laspinema olomoucense D3b TaxID=2953688 RepID=A0ABT2N7R0_9CYAN|nr:MULTISPECIES: carbamoyltransferase HypF [unclassified Laspinema]MCT7973298.1 carbamoyltransferase HypF [Laspinema sp. D3d]MCT7977316.1 carbamoyltransferase HypF [Laspinema sp. D3b]MCT7990781.1 carbamoyltransferase HypF [Laspinema sp. D3a]
MNLLLNSPLITPNLSRLSITVCGAVQGVGFRPFIYRLATELELNGWVNNSAQGVFIEVEGTQEKLETFLLRLEREKPAISFIQSLESTWLEPVGFTQFEIRPSVAGAKTAVVLPDIATCPDCLQEIFDPQNRRYRYPFTNCTNCGPRYTIIRGLPYDRANTSMQEFKMCPDCQAEYENPLNRRFHAQPNACPNCGPQLQCWKGWGEVLATGDRALKDAISTVNRGQILAVKGLGGFHLMVDAGNSAAVRRLRRCKHREEKPFAVMYPSLEQVRQECQVTAIEERLLRSPECPIVLLRRLSNSYNQIAPEVAPDNPYLGVMLPYTPLHHLLLAGLGKPVVATSGNLSDEPICIDEWEARDRLKDIADKFLVHNRPIVRAVDDSVVRVVAGREMVMRRARGYAPLPISLKVTPDSPPSPPPILAVGAHLKSAIAIGVFPQIFVSQHIGDLETPQAFQAFQEATASLQQLYEATPQVVARDAHPDYRSTRFAEGLALPQIAVQHHYAHVLACMAENQLLEETVLGVAWDGTGYGLDGTIWGGEFLRVSPQSWDRVAHFRTFPLLGGDKAVKEPRRVALGLLYEVLGNRLFTPGVTHNYQHILEAFTPVELTLLRSMLEKQINTPVTSSVGRLFDGVAAIAGLKSQISFEGQAATALEFALEGWTTQESYPLPLQTGDGVAIADWEPTILAILRDVGDRLPRGIISAKFHNTLVNSILAVAQWVGEERVVITGGCFQNAYLTEQVIHQLKLKGFRPYWHQRIPPNDGGIALGQGVAAYRNLTQE